MLNGYFEGEKAAKKEFSNMATEVTLYVEIDGRPAKTRVLYGDSVKEKMAKMAKINNAKRVDFVKVESDAAEWIDL